MKLTTALVLLLLTFVAGAHADRVKPGARACPVVGVKPLKAYVTSKQIQCFGSLSAVKKTELLPLTAKSAKKTGRAIAQAKKECNYIGLQSLGTFIRRGEARCFKNVRSAKKARFTRIVAPSPGSAPPPVGEAITYNLELFPRIAGSNNLSGRCTVVLSGARDRLSIACSHNVVNASEAHIHLIPDNGKFCVMPGRPALTFSYECSLTPVEATDILRGIGLFVIHSGPGQFGQEVMDWISQTPLP